MKKLRDYTPEELDALQNEMSGFISGFGFTWSTDYTHLIVCVKAKMEAEQCDYLNRPNPVSDIEKAGAKMKALRLESFEIGKRLVDTIRPDVEKAMEEKDFQKAHDICYTIPDCISRIFLLETVLNAEAEFNKKSS